MLDHAPSDPTTWMRGSVAPSPVGRVASVPPRDLKVAIIHYWLVGMRGGEKVVEALCEMYPDADIFTHVYDPEKVSPTIRRHRVSTTFISRLPRAAKNYKSYLPLMPRALEELDLRAYDLVISSESGPAKGVIVRDDAVHLCYCHTPMRYVWNMYHDYRERAGLFTKLLMPLFMHGIRNWDASTATRVHEFVANSRTVRRRIQTYYGRTSAVVNPPVDTESFSPVPASERGGFHLMVGELVRYKRPELAVAAFNAMGRPLVVIGGGEMLPEIRALAGPTVKVLGPQPFDVLRHHYARCEGLVFPGEEDFGIVPLEAMASGRPVIAYGRGGATETVIDGVTGGFFHEQTEAAIAEAVERVASLDLDPEDAVARAAEFGKDRFKAQMAEQIRSALERYGV